MAHPSRSGERQPRRMHPLPMNSQSGSSRSPFGAASYGVSKSFSPASQQAPEVVLTEAENDPDEEEELSSSPSGSEDNAGGADESRSAAERLAEKRRIKRFRLNHVQTRYLMNEFTRQPHPDAAQRERLSREIPGLKPRQVQVWFQNRRAKMKRLTTDDQERIMRSRALPEDFDLSQSLHPGSRRPSERPVPSLSSLTLREPSVNQRPNLTLNQDYGNMPPGSMSSVYGSPSPITGSASGSGNLSPASPYSGSHFSEGLSPVAATSRHDQLSRSNSLSVASQASQQQSGLSSRGGMGLMRAGTFPASEQQIPPSAGVPSPYNDNDPGIYQRAPLQSPDAYSSRQLQHASTYPQRSNLMPTQQSISPLTSPNPLLYERPLIKYPQAPGIPGYYTASYTQNIEFTGPWQAPTPVGGNPLSQGPRYLSDTEFTSDPNVYDQFASQRGQVGPLAQYIAVQPAESSQYEYAAPSGDFPITPGRRRGGRGNTYPNYYNPS